MRVPLLTSDFLDRAEAVYAERTAVVDEPDQPAATLGSLTYRDVADRARALAAGLDELGVAAGQRVAVVSHNAARLLELMYAVPAYGRILVPVNFRLRPDEVSYIVEHSGASVLLLDPDVDESLAKVTAAHRIVLGASSDEALLRPGREPAPGPTPTRTRRQQSTTPAGQRPDPRASSSPTATSTSTR